jgi:hypothetical protein
MTRIAVLSPIGTVRAGSFVAPPLPGTWRGRTVGFLDNTKANFDRLAEELGRLLRERYGVAAVMHRRKANAASPAPPGLIAELAKECDVVLAGSAD